MNLSILYSEILTRLKDELVTQYHFEYNDESLMSYDTQTDVLRILKPILTRLELEADQVLPADLDRIGYNEWIDICAQLMAYWTPRLENLVAEADVDQELHYQLLPVKDLLYESAVLVLSTESQILNTTIDYIRKLSGVYTRNTEYRLNRTALALICTPEHPLD